MKKRFFAYGAGAFVLALNMFVSSPEVNAVTAEEVLALRKAGVSDETIRLMIQLEIERARIESSGPGKTVGRKTIVTPDGKKRIVTYSITDPDVLLEERRRREEAERKSWDMLKNLVIDAR
jgi:hypothetical protein